MLVNKLVKELGVEVPLQEVFERQDIHRLGQYIAEATVHTVYINHPGPVQCTLSAFVSAAEIVLFI
jgi:hypothetical protein